MAEWKHRLHDDKLAASFEAVFAFDHLDPCAVNYSSGRAGCLGDGGNLAGSGDGQGERLCCTRKIPYSGDQRRIGDDPMFKWCGARRPDHHPISRRRLNWNSAKRRPPANPRVNSKEAPQLGACLISLHVSFWPNADMPEASLDVCFQERSGHAVLGRACRLMTQSRHVRVALISPSRKSPLSISNCSLCNLGTLRRIKFSRHRAPRF